MRTLPCEASCLDLGEAVPRKPRSPKVVRKSQQLSREECAGVAESHAP